MSSRYNYKPAVNFLLALSSILVTLLLLEGGIRVFDSKFHFMDAYDLKQIVGIYSTHPQLNHTINPNIDIIRPAHLDINIPGYHLRTNSLGFRFDPKRFVGKEAGVFRIAVLGDSHIEGYDPEYTLPNLLEKDLTKNSKSRKRIETMNFGVSSYSTLIHYVNLKRNVLRFKPDLVVLHYDLTDVYDDNMRYKELTVWDSDGNPDYINPSLYYLNLYFNINGKTVSAVDYGSQQSLLRPFYSPDRTRIWLLDHSFLFKYVYAKSHSGQEFLNLYLKELEPLHSGISTVRRIDDIPTILRWCESHDTPDMQKQMEFSFSILDKIFKLLERNNIPVVVITIPNRAHLSGTNQPSVWTRDSIDHIEAFCHKRGIPFHCPLTEFDDEVKRGTLLYYSDDMHANPTGMKLWSKSLSAYLLKTDIIR